MSTSDLFSTRHPSRQATTLVILSIVLIAAFRVLRATFLPELPNFAPITAIAFCGGLLLPGVLAWAVPFLALALSDVALSLVMGYPVLDVGQMAAWACTLAFIALGRGIASQGSFGLPKFLGGLIGGAVFFYLVTNSLAWFGNPAYPRTLDGLWMALTTGLPGFPPTWTFFRNSLVSDLLFGSFLLAIWQAARLSAPQNARPFTSVEA